MGWSMDDGNYFIMDLLSSTYNYIIHHHDQCMFFFFFDVKYKMIVLLVNWIYYNGYMNGAIWENWDDQWIVYVFRW